MSIEGTLRFQNLPQRGNCFIMPNAWDAGIAALLAQAGIAAIGTTSAGIACPRGLPDAAGALDFEQALRVPREIIAAVDIPLSMDSENAYAHDPRGGYENMKRILATGVAGASIEDYRCCLS